MRIAFTLVALMLAAPLVAEVRSTSYEIEPETAFKLFPVRTREGKAVHKRLTDGKQATESQRAMLGRLLIVASTKTPKLVDDNARHYIVLEAQEMIELWAVRYIDYADKAEAFLTDLLTGYPDENGKATKSPHKLIYDALKELRQRTVRNDLEKCFRGLLPSDECA